ncbi:nitroreductase family protein [Candidatus Lokiarchaeum ossiferum]|uniref:nitroreductase family protein n=1 Tax=Candidatus Lokiarchaeum ossiferum TaxID=2951803 RepID=UPI00352F2B04
MRIIRVNQEICTGCGQCISQCSSRLLSFSEKEERSKNSKKLIFKDPTNSCSLCGHCLAVCPTEAIEYEKGDPCFTSAAILDPKHYSYDNILEILRARRSIRQYHAKPVSREDIKAILEAMRYAPSASNEQNWEYLILTDSKQIQEFSQKVLNIIRLTYKLISNSLINTLFLWGPTRKLARDPSFLFSMKNLLNRADRGEDPIFFKAPCIILLHSPAYGNLAGNDAGIALTHGMLAARSLGLGTCWIGIAQETMQRIGKFNRWLGIPKGRTVWGMITLGHPKESFQRAPPREPLRIVWK